MPAQMPVSSFYEEKIRSFYDTAIFGYRLYLMVCDPFRSYDA
jgi:hypothetical protein